MLSLLDNDGDCIAALRLHRDDDDDDRRESTANKKRVRAETYEPKPMFTGKDPEVGAVYDLRRCCIVLPSAYAVVSLVSGHAVAPASRAGG